MKKLFFACCIAVAAISSQASYLWWTVSGGETGFGDVISYVTTSTEQGGLGLTSDDVVAQVVAVDGNNNKTVLQSEVPGLFDTDWSTTPQIAVNLGDLKGDGYSYYVEIMTMETTPRTAGYNSQATTYTSLAGSITETLSEMPTVTVWHGGSGGYKAAPEPTSAMLMLLGVAGLALRRKQRKLA